MGPSVRHVCKLLVRSRLVTVEEAKGLYRRWRGEAKDRSDDGGRFTQWLVACRALTAYQATLLGRGHTEGYFLSEYKILERLGRGRMAGVYKAVHRLGQVVAIKVLPPSRAKDPQLLARFQREARLATRLDHPNVVRAFQVGVEGELHYLVMEYLEGEVLEEVLKRRGQLSPPEAVQVIYQALLGLQHLHAHGLVHRDLKPSNLMLVPAPPGREPIGKSTVKVLDIGLGRDRAEEPLAGAAADDQLTGPGVLLGTPDYMSPEQARDARATDVRSDIYSLGCVLYHALAGRPPFPDTNVISQMVRHATEPPPLLREVLSAAPEGLQEVLDQMLAKDPSQRFPSPERAAQALRAFLGAGEDGAGSAAPGAPLQAFLQWLNHEPMTPGPAVAVPSKSPASKTTVSVPAAAGPEETAGPSRSSSPPPAPRTVSRRAKERRRVPDAAGPAPQTAPPSAPRETWDVELVPARSRAGQGQGVQLSRRDFLMLALGGGSVLFAVFLGWLLAQVLRNPPQTPERPEPAVENPPAAT
jgi:serine/threonine protein kinase